MRSLRLVVASALLGLLSTSCKHENASGNAGGDAGADAGAGAIDMSGQGCGLVTCASAGANCGPIGDGCGGTIDCGSCTGTQTCGGGGSASVCGGSAGCVPLTACPAGINCGPYPDGCGGLIAGGCGTCTNPGDICGGGGPGKCGPGISAADGGTSCTPNNTCPPGINCGPYGDGCGGLIPGGCGTCTNPGEACGFGSPGKPGVCGGGACVPKTCANYPAGTCGQQADGCGGLTTNCLTCPGSDFCGGGGPSKCGAGASTDMACSGLCLLQMNCGANPVTSVSGTVVAPTDTSVFGAADPINRAVVYVPNGAAGAPYYGVDPFTPNVSCDKCDGALLGNPLVIAQTGVDGKFKLDNVPVMTNLPLVIQVGKWRRMITIPSVTPCADNALKLAQTRLPRKHTEAGTTVTDTDRAGSPAVPVLRSDIPRIGFVTGGADPMECVLRKIGIDDSDFGDPSAPVGPGTGAAGHRIDFYQDQSGTGGAATYSANTPNASALYDVKTCANVADCPSVAGQACTAGKCTQTALGLYDMVVFACVGGEVNKTAAERNAVVAYSNAGGRVLNTHYSYVWTWGQPSADAFTPTATWVGDANSPNPDPLTAFIDTTFPKGQNLADWLQLALTVPAATTLSAAITTGSATLCVAATTNYPPVGVVKIDTELVEYTTVGTGGGCAAARLTGLTRAYNGSTVAAHASGAAVTFVYPYGQMLVNQPRYNMSAVAGGTTSQQWAYRNTVLPPDAPKAAAGTPPNGTTTLTQNLSTGGTTACVASVTAFPNPMPAGTYVLIGTEQLIYGGTSTSAGGCPGGSQRLTNLTRAQNGTTAATHANGDTVTLVYTAGFSPYTPMHMTFNTPVGASSQCGRVLYSDFHVYTGGAGWGGCDSLPMNAQEKLIEFMLFDLTDCVSADKCTPKSCADYGYSCGQWPDGCGGVTANCGPCTSPDTCGGGGVTGMCGHPSCTPLTCATLGYNCGVWGDGCGGMTASCGGCGSPQVCSGGGTLGMCGNGSCSPLDCATQGFQCGLASDGCGNVIDCGECGPGQICGGSGMPNKCASSGCTPKACPAGANCGVVADGCGGTVSCGMCTPPEVCGGSGVANVCGSTTVL
jgi:hypothetical protein